MKAVVFDMDGVLTDTEKIYRLYWREEGLKLGISEGEMDNLCDMTAGGTKRTNEGIFKEKLGMDFDYLSFRTKVIERFDRHIMENGVELKKDVEETLCYLKDKKISMAVATSTHKSKAVERLKMAGIYDYFDVMVYGDEIERGKPSPDIYLKACEKLQVSPDETVGVEDSINGVIAASDAGLYTVMVIDLISPNDITRKKASRISDSISVLKEIIY